MTAHRLLGQLVGWGAVAGDDGGVYRIGLRGLGARRAGTPRSGLRERGLPSWRASQIARENVPFAARDGAEVVFVERIAGSDAVPVLTHAGGRFSSTATIARLVLLPHAPAVVQEEVLTGHIERRSDRTVTMQRRRIMVADIRA